MHQRQQIVSGGVRYVNRWSVQQQYLLNSTPPTVLVLDSGVGGLSIYQQVRQMLPALHYLYAFDNAGFPYGERPATQVVERVAGFIEAIYQRHALSLVVLACNTASTVALPLLRERFPFPVVGVVPAIKSAVANTRNGIIGLLASKATVQSPYVEALITQFARDYRVERLGSSELVELAEAKLRGKVVTRQQLEIILAPWLPGGAADIDKLPDTIVLGCTHFPLLRAELVAVLSPAVVLIDSAAAVTQQVARQLIASVGDETLRVSTKGDGLQRLSQAYCTRWDAQARALLPALRRYQLASLQAFPLIVGSGSHSRVTED